MANLLHSALKIARKIYRVNKPDSSAFGRNWEVNNDIELVSNLIYQTLNNSAPCMIGRFGANELSCVVNYIAVKQKKRNIIKYIKGESVEWWWNQNIIEKMQTGAGFFPADLNLIEQFCQLMIKDIPELDLLGSWLPQEKYFRQELIDIPKVNIELLNPFFSTKSWTKALEGKKVLVIHPFAKTIQQQYQKREFLFENNLLPQFELNTIQAVQSIAGEKTDFDNWFDALYYMESEIDKVDFDICLIGAGAYGFPLAAYVKRKGKKAFHLGGSLQLLFGIRGKRWENPDYNPVYNYSKLMNDYWVKPNENETPKKSTIVENACYW